MSSTLTPDRYICQPQLSPFELNTDISCNLPGTEFHAHVNRGDIFLLCSSFHLTISEIEWLLSLQARKLAIVTGMDSDTLKRLRKEVVYVYFRVSPVLQHTLDGTLKNKKNKKKSTFWLGT